MDEDEDKQRSQRALEQMREQLQRDLQALAARVGSGHSLTRHADDPYAPELEYQLTQLSSALNAVRASYSTFDLYSHRNRAELLARIDAVLAQATEIHAIAERVREVLLRPPPSAPA
jgi:hypothetical protein